MISFAPLRARLAGLRLPRRLLLRVALVAGGAAGVTALRLGVHDHAGMAGMALLLWVCLTLALLPAADGLAVVAYSAGLTLLTQPPGRTAAQVLVGEIVYVGIAVAFIAVMARTRRATARREAAIRERDAALRLRDAALLDAYTALAARNDALDEARAALRLRDDFLTAANHDLRTPLTAVVGYVSLMQQRIERGTATVEWIAAQLCPLGAASRRMARIVDDIADATAAGTGRDLDLHAEPLILRTLVAGVVATLPTSADRGRIHLDVPDDAGDAAVPPVCVVADKARLERVVQNLLDNALKYSSAPIEVTVRIEDESAVLTVRDRGCGIPADELPRIFERFYRASNAPRHAGGTGIGLVTARAIVERHGGTITLESAVGVGTTVTVRLPV